MRANGRQSIILVFILLLQGSAAAILAQGHGDDEKREPTLSESTQDLLRPAGEIAFNRAWPTAKYTGMTLGGVALADHGFDVSMKLLGKGLNKNYGEDLWLMVVISFRNGHFQRISYGGNNGYYPPLFIQNFTENVTEALIAYFSKEHPSAIPEANSPLSPGVGGWSKNPNLGEPNLPLQHAETFDGGLGEFDDILPELMERAALKWKMPVHSLDAEAQEILKGAAQCSSLTPAKVASLSATDRSQLETGHNYPNWQACEGGLVNVTRRLRQYDTSTERGVVYSITPEGGWHNAKAIDMKILMTGLPGDHVFDNLFSYYGVVAAKISVAPIAIPVASLSSQTRAAPVLEGNGIITAPGRGAHAYNIFYVDARAFPHGGVLDVAIKIDSQSSVSGSFEIFPNGTTFTPLGASSKPLASQYDIAAGSTVHLLYKFDVGQVFVFGAEGSWGSKAGETGNINFQASLRAP